MQCTVRHKIIHTQNDLSTVKWEQWDKTQSRELLGLFICVCSSLCTIVAHNTAQNRPYNFPSCPPDSHHCSDDVYLREGGPMIFKNFNSLIFTGKSAFSWTAMDPALFGNPRTKNQTDQCWHLATIHQHHTQIHTHIQNPQDKRICYQCWLNAHTV